MHRNVGSGSIGVTVSNPGGGGMGVGVLYPGGGGMGVGVVYPGGGPYVGTGVYPGGCALLTLTSTISASPTRQAATNKIAAFLDSLLSCVFISFPPIIFHKQIELSHSYQFHNQLELIDATMLD